jgi:ankyrin repeat protein
MNDPMMSEGIWPTWLSQVMWLEWMRPFLYCLLAIAVVSLVLALLDLALLCWKEFHTESTKTSAKTEPRRKAGNEAVIQAKSTPLIRALFLLACCWQVSPVVWAQEHSPALNTAIRNGDLKQVKSLLAKGANINAQDADGTTPLMHAVVNAGADCVKLLIEKGADPNLSNKVGATALMWAVNDLKKIQLLLARGAQVNAVSKDEKSPLLLALNLPNSMAVVQALLAKGANINQADKRGFTPLMAAGFSGNLDLIQLLLAKGADPRAKTKDGFTHLKAIVFSNKLLAVKWALEQGLAVNNPKENFLFGPAITGDLALARLLLDKGATPNPADQGDFTPLMVAVITEDSSLEMVKLLLERGANPKAKTKAGWTALTFATRKGWAEAVALLTKAGVTE